MVEPVDQRMQRREIGILLVGIERHLVVTLQRIEFLANARQPRRVGDGITQQLQLEVSCTGVLAGIRNPALTFNEIVEADGMPDGNTRQRLPAG
ncbi:hypothetical protein ACVWZ6_003917 [Bradyrhizobium sp. GM6.1]